MINELTKLYNRGLSLIPIAGKTSQDKDGAKRPLISWQEYQQRRASLDEIQNWINIYPKRDIGVVTGPISQILVLDIDGEDGELSLRGFNLPVTWTVKTKRGWHYYFRWTSTLDGKVTTKAGVKPGVDVRGEGGYVVAPPSAGYNGTPYRWHRAPDVTPLAVPPEWLVNLLPAKGSNLQTANEAAKSSGKSWVSESLNGIREGNRNESFTKIAGSLRARGYETDVIFSLLQDKAKAIGFSEGELRIVCESVGRYAKGTLEQAGTGVETFLKDEEKIEWLCEPLVAKKTIGFTVGLPETMKTWLLIDLAIECARGGGTWLNRFPVKAGRVLFIDQERFKGETQRRFRAVLKQKKLDPAALNDTLYIRCGTTTRINMQSSYDALKKEIADIRPDLVIVDSFATFHTCDENNRQSIQDVLERTKQLRNEFGCSFIFIHHENKYAFNAKKEDREPSIAEMAGSVAIPAAAEFVLTVRRQDPLSSFVHHTKSTLAATVPPFLVKVTDTVDDKSEISVEAF
jgi:hypothetical protein